MKEATSSDLIRHLLPPSAESERLSDRVEALTTVVLDLLCEVEALRKAQAEGSEYRDAYGAACLLTHNNAGPSSGPEKMIDRYYPRDRLSDGRVWRESLMMRRLGFTSEELEAFKREAEEAELYS